MVKREKPEGFHEMAANSVFKVTEAEHDNLDLLMSVCRCWEKYLQAFSETLPNEPPRYLDNEMSSVGSLAAGISRFSEKSFIIHEAVVGKKGNEKSKQGRCDLLAFFPGDRTLSFEAKRHRQCIKVIDDEEGQLDLSSIEKVFAQDESVASRRSLIGKGLRDYAKSAGSKQRVRRRNGSDHVMLLLATVDIYSQQSVDNIKTELTDAVRRIFKQKVTVRLSGGTSRKSLAGLPTVGFLYLASAGEEEPLHRKVLMATMTLI